MEVPAGQLVMFWNLCCTLIPMLINQFQVLSNNSIEMTSCIDLFKMYLEHLKNTFSEVYIPVSPPVHTGEFMLWKDTS